LDNRVIPADPPSLPNPHRQSFLAAEKVLSGQAEPDDIIDPWNRRLKQYSFGRFAITTHQ
jgi:hypothetical protein